MFNSTPVSRKAGLTALAAIACAAAVVPCTASAAATGNAQSSTPVSSQAWQAGKVAFGANATAGEAVAAYWTQERMSSARPVEEAPFYKAAMARGDRQAVVDQRQSKTARPVQEGTPFEMPPADSTAAATTAFNPNLPSSTPTARSMGKVFFTKGAKNYACSGTVVNTEGLDTVWTAGHCVHGGAGGTWHTNWSFAPAYDDDLVNRRPYGTWTAKSLGTRTAWVNSSTTSEDMGVAIMNTNFGGWHIVNYLGGHGFRVNQGKKVFENAFGYPSETPFDGGNLYRCWGNSTPEWSALSETIKIPCDMTRGSSGGAWLHGYNGNWGYLNGVNSRIDHIFSPTIMLSPYFDNTALSLFNATRNL